jgi:hypothetical protein
LGEGAERAWEKKGKETEREKERERERERAGKSGHFFPGLTIGSCCIVYLIAHTAGAGRKRAVERDSGI